MLEISIETNLFQLRRQFEMARDFKEATATNVSKMAHQVDVSSPGTHSASTYILQDTHLSVTFIVNGGR